MKLSAKFHLSMGLTSIVVSLLLLAILANMIPDRREAIIASRATLSIAVASSSTLFLRNQDYASIKDNIEFILSRDDDLLTATISRVNDKNALVVGDESRVSIKSSEERSTDSRMVMPILDGDRTWGHITLYFAPITGVGWLAQVQNSRFVLVGFCSLFGFLLFYLYLGRMLNELNPSQAVPTHVRSALDTLAEALLVIDQKSNIVLANKAFQDVTGIDNMKLLGRKAESFSWSAGDGNPLQSSQKNELPQFPWQRALHTQEPTRHDMIWLQNKDGQWHKFIVNCSPVMSSGGTAGGVLISFDDVTTLEEKEAEIRLARDAAEEANKAKSDFLSNMSHEIRTPMTAILGFTDVLSRSKNPAGENWQKHLKTISNSGKHLLELINDVLDLSKVESGALVAEQIDCAAHVVTYDVVQVLRVRAQEKGIELHIEIPEALPELIQSDPSRLRQIVTNLVGNAIKFTETGGVSVKLRIVQQQDKPMLAIDVIDSGIGMNDQQQAAVFQPFVQADSSITRRFGGTGLGLAISRKLARVLGGDIVLSSEAGVGTTFTALVNTGPLDNVRYLQPDEVFAVMQQSTATTYQEWRFPTSHVLIVDDAAENRELLSLVLGDLGIDTDTAENGAIAVEMATARHYDVILSDIQMPVMDGYKATAVMREKGLEIPIIALTANAMKGFEATVIEAGFSGYMTKPIDIDALTKLLADLLGGIPVVSETQATQDSESVSSLEPAKGSINATDSDEHYQTIHSRLAANEKFVPIIENFIERLQTQTTEMDKALASQKLDELAALGHWLRGSAGTVGFDAFTVIAKSLEDCANANEITKIPALLAEIRSLAGRLRAAPDTGSSQGSPPLIGPQPVVHHITDSDSASAPIESALPTSVPKFRSIVVRFIPRLHMQLNAMAECLEKEDFDGMAALAHWLKGSGGTVGFGMFTEPAANLEVYAKEANREKVQHYLEVINAIATRLVMPENDDRDAA